MIEQNPTYILPSQAIENAYMEVKTEKIKRYPATCVRASQIGHPCLRYLYNEIVNWEQKKLYGPELQCRFDEGVASEERMVIEMQEIKRKLQEKGLQIEIYHRPEPYEYKQNGKVFIRGSLDFQIEIAMIKYPLEYKTMIKWVWEKLSYETLTAQSDDLFFNKYYGQHTTYMILANKEWGLFLSKVLPGGLIKPIWIKLDYQYGEELLQKSETVMQAVSKQNPELCPILNDGNVCQSCEYYQFCLPNIIREMPQISIDAYLISLLEERQDMLLAGVKDKYKEYDSVDKEIKAKIKNFWELSNRRSNSILIGRFWINIKESEKKTTIKISIV
jgi:hypothetical protein